MYPKPCQEVPKLERLEGRDGRGTRCRSLAMNNVRFSSAAGRGGGGGGHYGGGGAGGGGLEDGCPGGGGGGGSSYVEPGATTIKGKKGAASPGNGQVVIAW